MCGVAGGRVHRHFATMLVFASMSGYCRSRSSVQLVCESCDSSRTSVMSSDASVIWESLVQERAKSESLVRERCSSELPEEERFIRVKFVRRSLLTDDSVGAADFRGLRQAASCGKWSARLWGFSGRRHYFGVGPLKTKNGVTNKNWRVTRMPKESGTGAVQGPPDLI